VQDIVARGQELWVMAPGRVDRLDPDTNTVVDSLTIGATSDLYNGVAANAAGVWATNSTTSLLDRVDPVTRKIVGIPAGLSPKGVLATAAGVWVADVHGGSVLPVDQATNKVGTPIMVGPTGSSGPNWLATGLGSLWVGVPNNNTIVRFNPATGAVEATIKTLVATTPCGGIAVGRTAVWITSCSSTTSMARIDPTTNTAVKTVEMGGYGYNPTLINDAPWISVDRGGPDLGLLARINPATNAIDRILVPGPTFGGGGDILVAAGSVWVTDGYNNSVLRLPLTSFQP
jgi:streptogramin lyase